MKIRSAAADQLTRLLLDRAPRRTIIRGSMGDGAGTVLYPRLDDYAYVRLYDNDSTLVTARNLTVPMMDDLPVDVERTYIHSKVQYVVIGLTQGIQFPTGTQPIANAVLHAYTHAPGGYDPITGGVLDVTLTAVSLVLPVTARFVGVTSTAAPRSITLPDATKVALGTTVVVKDLSGGAAGNNISVFPIAAQQIDNAGAGTARVISTNYGSVMVVAAYGGWWIVATRP